MYGIQIIIDGQPTVRTKFTHTYSYDPILQWRGSDEANGTVTHGCMAATGVEAERLIIRTAVVGAPPAGGRSTLRRLVLVDRNHP